MVRRRGDQDEKRLHGARRELDYGAVHVGVAKSLLLNGN